MGAPLTPQIALADLIVGKLEFDVHYSVTGNPGFAADIVVGWMDLKDAVENQGGIPNIKEIAVKLIHRYDNVNWFLTMEVCHMNMQNGQLDVFGNRFDLNGGAVTPSAFVGDFDPNYFANVLCDGNPTSPAVFVNNVIMPWYQEIKEMHCQNSLPNDPTIFVKFASCSYDYSNIPGAALVQFPHTVIISMNSSIHGDYVDDANYTTQFANRAADLNGMCPPKCNVYNWPPTLPGKTNCLP